MKFNFCNLPQNFLFFLPSFLLQTHLLFFFFLKSICPPAPCVDFSSVCACVSCDIEIMLRPKVVPQILAQANTDGVYATMSVLLPHLKKKRKMGWCWWLCQFLWDGIFLSRLLTTEGALLAFAGESEKQSRVVGAIACHIWMIQEKNGKACFDNDNLNTVIFANEVTAACWFFPHNSS